MSTKRGSRWREATGRGARRALLAGVLSFVLAAVGLLTVPVAAQAADGDFTVALTTEPTVPFKENYNYTASITYTGVNATNPSAPTILTTILPEGTAFESVPSGDGQPVSGYTYNPTTRELVLTLRPATEQLVSVVYTVRQVDNDEKYSGMTLDTSMTATGGPSGPVSSGPVSTEVVSGNDYYATKSAATVNGSDNRTVTYTFGAGYAGTPFTSHARVLTDVFPAGTVLVGTTGAGWDTSAFPTAVFTSTALYGANGDVFNAGTITVRYPASVPEWQVGSRPPVNTVTLRTQDANGVWRDQAPASTQGPVFGEGGAPGVSATKSAPATSSAGLRTHYTQTTGAYNGADGTPDAPELVLTDSGAAGLGSNSWYHHNDVSQLYIQFDPSLTARNLGYKIEYQTNWSATWTEYTAYNSAPTTANPKVLSVANVGSTNLGGTDQLMLEVGQVLTGWRVTLAPSEGETVPVGSEVRVRLGSQPVFRDIADGIFEAPAAAGVGPGVLTNTLEVTAAGLTGTASAPFTPLDSVHLTTNISAPTSLSVGGSGVFTAGIVNQNPSETYEDSVMNVVLPCGVLYDGSSITPLPNRTEDVGIPQAPSVGEGVSVDTSKRIVDADGCEQQVITFSFDEIAPMRAPGAAKNGEVGTGGWRYQIPVIALAQSYDPTEIVATATSYVSSEDPRFIAQADGGTGAVTVPMLGHDFFPDVPDFDPNRTVIAVASANTSINTAGGLLISKLSSASATGPWALTTEVGAESFWQIYVSDILPNPVTNVVFFDKLPSIADGDDFDTHLTGPVTGAPAGATVEYSTDATSATTGTWTTNPAEATAFRIAAGTLTSGAAFTLVVPTANLGDLSYGQTDTNTVSATGVYGGTPVSFASNEAAVTVQAVPSLSLVKKTNGVEYDAAPGALVAEGSTVTWTYEVTNTGDVPLDDITVADAFVDGSGAEGDLAPVSPATGPLLPGETRTFEATGTAVAGQYQNTATATATAVDEAGAALPQQPTPAIDDSWYLAGDSGLSIVKTTNGEDVTSAPGLWLTPGQDVEWAYTVTNTGGFPLVDVSVIDVDADGETVFDSVIDRLEPGESVTLTAEGIAIVGQYHNTVTAEASDPVGDGTLSAADDSWYFGVESGIAVDKLVAASLTGPWAESVEVKSGAATYWQLTVTNTGNSPLTDVTLDDPKLGETVDIGDLAAGESAVVVLTLDRTTQDITNVVAATGTDPLGGSVTDADDAKATVVVSGLAITGGGFAVGMLVLGLAFLGGGAFFLIRRRRSAQ
ncbi:hypothetical protein [Microbacterium sp. NPDC087665]|uniref:DUF7507 domain-containing protein n=1 Tax=Microbacterium sp. NPDC087665 TaxID=3364194 RepID=UPI0037F34511